VRTKHGRGFLDTEANEREWIKSVALTELSSLTASSTMRRLGFFFFFGASPLHTKTIANDREIRIRQACYLERRLKTEQGRSTRRFLGRAASRAPQQHDRDGRWTPSLFSPLLRCAVPRAGLAAGATLQGEAARFGTGRAAAARCLHAQDPARNTRCVQCLLMRRRTGSCGG